jgi:DNA primase
MEQIIEKYLGKSTHTEGSNNYYHCPVCHWKKPRLSVSYEQNKFHCWKCGWGGKSLSSILFTLNAEKSDIVEFYTLRGENRTLTNSRTSLDDLRYMIINMDRNLSNAKKYYNITLPDGFVPLHKDIRKFVTIPIRDYLFSRGISKYEIEYYDIHYNFSEGKILIPSYDENGKLNFYVSRTASHKNKYYENPHSSIVKKTDIIFFESILQPSDSIILTEGVFDAIKIGYNALPILGSFFNNTLISFLQKGNNKSVILAMDKDAIENMLKKSYYFLKCGIQVYMIDYNKTDEGDDPSSISKETLREMLKKENLIKIDQMEILKQQLNQINALTV